jgi:DNA-binding LytR/AlgR family response regulator
MMVVPTTEGFNSEDTGSALFGGISGARGASGAVGGSAGSGGSGSADELTKLRVLAVDDEAPALADLVFELRAQPGIGEVVAVADATEALRAVRIGNFDAVFLDVRMPGLDGLELARVLQQFRLSPVVVFVTAYDAHAVDAFEIAAADYLLKPVRRERLNEAMRRVRTAVALRNDRENDRPVALDSEAQAPGGVQGSSWEPVPDFRSDSVPGKLGIPQVLAQAGIPNVSLPSAVRASYGDLPSPLPAQTTVENEKISVESGGRVRVIARRDVLYVAASGDYVRLFLADSSVLYRSAISALEQRWGPAGFVRIHRGYLVNLRHVDEVRVETGRGYLVAIRGRSLPVSRRLARSLKQRLLDDLPPE